MSYTSSINDVLDGGIGLLEGNAVTKKRKREDTLIGDSRAVADVTVANRIPDGNAAHSVNGTVQTPVATVPVAPLKLDLGCGTNKRQDGGPWTGVDAIAFPGVDYVTDLRQRWPWADSSVTEAHTSHFVEHLTAWERVHFVNELHRVLVPGGKCQVIVPHWASCRAYGDPSHQWPPVSEFWFYYLSREWRLGNAAKGLGANAPHTDAAHRPDGFSCDFRAEWGYTMNAALQIKHAEVQQYAMQWYKEAIQDIVATLTKV